MTRHITSTKAYKIETGGADRTLGWRVTVEGDDATQTVRVEIAQSVATSPNLSLESQEAKKSAGRSAVRRYLGDDRLPTLIVIHEDEAIPHYDESEHNPDEKQEGVRP
jgi:hypothetical protein